MPKSTEESGRNRVINPHGQLDAARSGVSGGDCALSDKDKLDAILRALPDIVFYFDREGRFKEYYAPEPVKLYEQPERFLERKIEEVIPGETGAALLGAFRRARDTGEKQVLQYSLDIAGGTHYFESTYIPIVKKRLPVDHVIAVVHDVTDRKRAEHALKKSEQEKATVLNVTSELVIYYNTEMKILWANRASAESVGLSPERMVGQSCHELWYGTDALCEGCPVAIALKSGSDAEDEIRTPDGKDWYIRAYPAKNTEGEVVGVVELALDISDRKKTEAELKRAKEYAESLIETANVMVVGLDENGTIVIFNKTAEKITGYTREELDGKDWFELITPKDKYPEVWRVFEDWRRNNKGIIKCFENPIVTKSGEERYISWTNNEVVGNRGKKETISFGVDITERKRAEEALMESEQRYKSLAEAAQDLIFIIDREGIVRYVNSFAAEMVGKTPEDIIGGKRDGLFSENVSTRQRRNLQKVFETGEAVHVETITSFGSRSTWLDTRLVPIKNAAGEVVSVLGISRDISERKQAEEQVLRAKQEAEFYLDLMSHDLTNFNQTILGNITLIEMQSNLTDKQRKYIESCKRQLGRSENLISKVRAFSQIKHINRQNFRVMDLNKIVADAVNMVKTLYPNKVDEIEFKPSGSKTARGTELLDSVLTNVIENAVKHTKDEKAHVEVSIVDSERDPEGFWEIRIADGGPGIPEEMKERIFDRYLKIGVEKGMGLGLSLARAVTEKFGGNIWVEDRVCDGVPSGSVFKIAIPKAKE